MLFKSYINRIFLISESHWLAIIFPLETKNDRINRIIFILKDDVVPFVRFFN